MTKTIKKLFAPLLRMCLWINVYRLIKSLIYLNYMDRSTHQSIMDQYQRQQSQGSASSQINNGETAMMQMNRTGGGAMPMLGSTINMQSTTQITDISKRQKRPKKKVKREP